MKRRDFLKLIGVAVVAPGTVVAVVKEKQPVIRIDPSKPHRWKNFYAEYVPTKADIEKFRKALKEIKFVKPKDRVYLVTFRGIPLIYEPNLSYD